MQFLARNDRLLHLFFVFTEAATVLNAPLATNCRDSEGHPSTCSSSVRLSHSGNGCAYFSGSRNSGMRVENVAESMKLTQRGWTISWRMKPAKRSYFPIIEYQKSASYWGLHIWHYGNLILLRF